MLRQPGLASAVICNNIIKRSVIVIEGPLCRLRHISLCRFLEPNMCHFIDNFFTTAALASGLSFRRVGGEVGNHNLHRRAGRNGEDIIVAMGLGIFNEGGVTLPEYGFFTC